MSCCATTPWFKTASKKDIKSSISHFGLHSLENYNELLTVKDCMALMSNATIPPSMEVNCPRKFKAVHCNSLNPVVQSEKFKSLLIKNILLHFREKLGWNCSLTSPPDWCNG